MQCDLYDSVEALLAKLQSGNSGYDIVVPSDYAVQILQRQRLLSPLDKAQIPNLERNLDPQFLGRPFDPRESLFRSLHMGHNGDWIPQRPGGAG